MAITQIVRAALYLRSSKDRSDVSIDVQRRQLQEMAAERGYAVMAEFSDVVESGKDENRPGFQQLLAAVRNKRRGWDTLLILDTSRLARRRHISMIFEEVEAKKFGVRVVYKSLPESDPITEMLLKSILQAMDQWHSMNSKNKGMAGMAENVRQGWRAGGRAPMGYALEHTGTGAIREGMPVMKSKLIVSSDAPRMAAYLKLRAQGVVRSRAKADAGLPSSDSTLVSVEWNALTYAGHTVWNMRQEFGDGGYEGGVKSRARKDWIIQRDTHQALISDDEAEAIIVRLESFDRGHHVHGDYLLSGILKSAKGQKWVGSEGGANGFYRIGKGKRIKASTIEGAVLAQLIEDLRTPDFIEDMTAAARRQFDDERKDTDLPMMKKEAADLERRIKRLTEMLADTVKPDLLLRQIEEYEARSQEIIATISRREDEAKQIAKVRALAVPQVTRVLDMIAEEFETMDRAKVRELLTGLVEQIVIDETAQTFQITYRLQAATGVRLASPRRNESNPGVFIASMHLLKRA